MSKSLLIAKDTEEPGELGSWFLWYGPIDVLVHRLVDGHSYWNTNHSHFTWDELRRDYSGAKLIYIGNAHPEASDVRA